MQQTKRLAFSTFLIGLLLVVALWAGPAAAGGWATVTLEELPTGIVVGRPFTVRFTVRQHGQTPLAGLTPTLTVEHAESGHSLKTAVHEMKQAGLYEVTMTLPEAGQWRWSIHTFGTVYQQPPLTAAAAAPPAAAAPAASLPSASGSAVGAAALLIAGVLGLAWLRRPRPIWLLALAGFLLVAVAAFGWQWLQPPAQAAGQETSAAISAKSTGLDPAAASCPVSPAVYDQPPDDPNADPFGHGPWYVNEYRSMWVNLPPDESWPAGEGQKVIWIRPAGTELVIDAQRLDGEAAPLEAGIPCCYPTGFQVTGLTFPVGGCWQVTATAGESRLDFTTWVEAAAAPEETGEALFVAKGCIQCHRNDNVSMVAASSYSIGPDLTQVKRDPGYLRRWLADPAAVKPGTQMPNLNLSPAEIDALVDFLKSG